MLICVTQDGADLSDTPGRLCSGGRVSLFPAAPQYHGIELSSVVISRGGLRL